MFNLSKFIGDYVTGRPVSMFEADIQANAEKLTAEIKGKKVCVVGGAGSIGSSFIKAVLRFEPASVVVVDLNENGLAELVRDVRSTEGLYVPEEFRCYTLNFADPIFERIFREEKGFDIFANFSAHKHVRSEKDKYSVQALIENNDIKPRSSWIFWPSFLLNTSSACLQIRLPILSTSWEPASALWRIS